MKYKVLAALAFLLATASWAQTAGTVNLDGIITDGEYASVQTKDGFTVAARLSADGSTLYVAVSAQTAGWVSIGLGTKKMDGSFMTLGYVADGKPSISFERGKGLSHAPTPAPGANAIVRETGGVTTLEVSVPASLYMQAGILETIAASGTKDDFKSMHAKRTALALKL